MYRSEVVDHYIQHQHQVRSGYFKRAGNAWLGSDRASVRILQLLTRKESGESEPWILICGDVDNIKLSQ